LKIIIQLEYEKLVELEVNDMAKITNAEAVLRGLATMKPELVESLLKAQIENIEASGLDPKTYAMVKIAALVAMDASPASYAWNVELAKGAGVTPEELTGVLVALAPTVGFARIVPAAAEISFALGYEIEEYAKNL
jgi:alkylhydroperoxidase/carboxymuconolactone decarboxylase family protein YurZ